jgi:hypothetical protein
MVAARTAAKGLSTSDLEQIRDTLAAGRKPKVVFTEAAGQIAGQLGQVVQLTDPELSEEWVVVRFGKDELPFSPADLAIAPKTASVRRAPTVPSPREEITVPALSTVDDSAAVSPDEEPATLSPDPAPVPPSSSSPDTAPDTDAGSGRAAAVADPDTPPARGATKVTAAKKAAKPKAPPGLTVTVTYADGEWTVAANQGAKPLAKPYLIKPAEALRMVAMLDVPGVHEAVEEIVSAARAEAEKEADRLRSELAEIEARLAELRESTTPDA